MTSNHRRDESDPTEAASRRGRRAPLGPPHDVYATLGLTVAFAAALFFDGRVSAEADAWGWIGMIASLAAAVGFFCYFQRAYGFASRGSLDEGWGRAPTGAVIAIFFAFFYVMGFIPEALYQGYFEASLLAYSVSCLALATLPLALLRASLGQATAPSDSR